MSEIKDLAEAKLKDLAKLTSKSMVESLRDLVRDGKHAELAELAEEILALKAEALAVIHTKGLQEGEADRVYYAEEIEAVKLTIAHKIDEQRLMVEAASLNVIKGFLDSALAGFTEVGTALVRVAVKGAASGLLGGGLGEVVGDMISGALSPE